MAVEAPVPPLSIVVVSFNDAVMLQRCLTSLADQAIRHGAEVIVVRAAREDDAAVSALRERTTHVTWIRAEADETIPRLRARGLLAARGAIVGLLEDDCIIDPLWCAAALDAHRDSAVAIGGAVEPAAYRRARDWAVYFYEYGRFMLPFPPHRCAVLPGNNVIYKRAEAVAALSSDGGRFYDVSAHAAWDRAGREMQITPALVVANGNTWSASQVTIAPFHHGRGYAAQRVAGRSAGERLGRAALTPLLPAVQVLRLIRQTNQRRRLRGRLVAALPWLTVFAVCWAAGECVGYLAGPGRSLERWR
jgi:hypothetical protein